MLDTKQRRVEGRAAFAWLRRAKWEGAASAAWGHAAYRAGQRGSLTWGSKGYVLRVPSATADKSRVGRDECCVERDERDARDLKAGGRGLHKIYESYDSSRSFNRKNKCCESTKITMITSIFPRKSRKSHDLQCENSEMSDRVKVRANGT